VGLKAEISVAAVGLAFKKTLSTIPVTAAGSSGKVSPKVKVYKALE